MSKSFFYICTLLSLSSFCQDTVQMNASYEFVYVRDLENKQTPYRATMILSLGKTTSRYCTDKLYNDNDPVFIAEWKKQQQQMDRSGSGGMTTVVGGPLLTVGKYGAVINEEITKDLAQKKQTINTKIASKEYYVETGLPEIKWTLIDDSVKKINGYNCEKATGVYGGRQYDVWFTRQIPFSNGPWKLHGLPGLIVEARDRTGEVFFTLKRITRSTRPGEMTKSFMYSPYSIKSNINDVNRARIAFESDPEGVIGAQTPNARISVKNLDDPNDKTVTKIRRYNPIER